MRLNIPTNPDGSPLITHMQINSMLTVPVQRDADGGYFIPNVHSRRFVGLLQGKNGVAWDRANPRKPQ
jgi:hypothetical protein